MTARYAAVADICAAQRRKFSRPRVMLAWGNASKRGSGGGRQLFRSYARISARIPLTGIQGFKAEEAETGGNVVIPSRGRYITPTSAMLLAANGFAREATDLAPRGHTQRTPIVPLLFSTPTQAPSHSQDTSHSQRPLQFICESRERDTRLE